MAHTYASLLDAKRYATDEGIAWGSGSTNDALALSILESVSRRVDFVCHRSSFGSGFGPRTGTNEYDARYGATLDLLDDCLSITSVTSYADTAHSSSVTPVEDTDFYLVNQAGTYSPAPYRRLVLHRSGSVTQFGWGLKVISIVGTWGHAADTTALTATGTVASTSTTTLTLSAADAALSAGQTLLIESEQVYVRSYADDATTAVIDRGVNGTTAATHSAGTALAYYRYDSRVWEATLRVWLRRWAARNSASNTYDGGGDIGTVRFQPGEDRILREALGELRLMGQAVFGGQSIEKEVTGE